MRVLDRRAILAMIAANLIFATAALAQMPASPWKKAAPFPEPDEELYGVAVNGKLYVIGGWGIRCMEQLNDFAAKSREFAERGIDLVAVSTDSPDNLQNALADYQKEGGFPIPLLSDARLEIFRAYGCIDSDNQPLHGTFLIDAQGRIRFRDISNRPFNDPAFLLTEGKQLLSVAAAR